MKTLDYILGQIGEIGKGNIYYFGQIWDGNGEAEELLESGSISPDGENVAEFEIVERRPDPLETLVKITDIF